MLWIIQVYFLFLLLLLFVLLSLLFVIVNSYLVGFAFVCLKNGETWEIIGVKDDKKGIGEGQNVLGIVFQHVYKQKNKKRIDGSGFLGWNYQPLAKPPKFMIREQLLSEKLTEIICFHMSNRISAKLPEISESQ